MMKFLYLPVALLPGLSFSAYSQSDTAMKKSEIKEVVIVDNRLGHDAFSFFRSGKLATTEDILARMPGVNMIRRGAYGLEPSLRIYSAGQINVTIDGMKMYGACTDKMDPASIYIEPNNLDEISITHGSAGSIRGSNIGGGVDMTLKKPMFTFGKVMSVRLSQSFSSINTGLATNMNINASSRTLASSFSFVYRNANNYKDGNGKTVGFSQYKKMNWSGALSYKLGAKNSLSVQYLGDIGKNIGFPALTMDAGSAIAHIASISHQFTKSSSLFKSVENKFYYNNVYHSMDDTKRPSVPIHMDMPGWSETWGAYNETVLARNKHEFRTRIDGHSSSSRADMIMYPVNEAPMYMQTLPSNNLHNTGISLQYAFFLDSIQSIHSSVRVDFYNQYANRGIGALQWEVMNQDITRPVSNILKNGSLSYSRKLNKRIETAFTASYGQRLPTTNERYGYYLYIRLDGFDYIGNPELKPESAWQGELRIKLNTEKIQPYVNMFYHLIENYIYPFVYAGYSSMTIGARGVKGYANIRYATLQGAEGGISYTPIRKIIYIATMKYTYATTNEGTPIAQVPPFKIQQALRCEYKKIQTQIEYDWASAQKRINPASREQSTSAWHLINIRLSRNIQFSRSVIQLNAGCENVFNMWYREHLDLGNIGRPGRNFVFTISYSFR